MSPLLRFPDVQRLLVDDLEALAGAGHTGVQTPADLAVVLPFVRVLRVGGGSGRLNDYPVLDIDVFASTYTEGELLAEQVRQRLVGPPPAAVLLDSAYCETGPHELPWGDDQIRRFGATYTVTVRRRLMPT